MTKEITATGRKAIADLAAALRLPEGGLDIDPAARKLRHLIVHRDGIEITARPGDRWSSLLMFALEAGTMGHAKLGLVIGGVSAEGRISQRMLTLRLRTLERDGLVARTVSPSVPPRVDYALTPLGQELMGLIRGIVGWIETNHHTIVAAHQKFEAAETERKHRGW